MSLLTKGAVVSFILEDKKHELLVPPTHIIVHDPIDEVLRSCDFYIVPFKFDHTGVSHSDAEMRRLAEKYYGTLDDLCEVGVEIPEEGWEFLTDVQYIRYRREGFLADDYQHKYAFPQPLYYNEGFDAYRLASPDSCVANHRGFVHP